VEALAALLAFGIAFVLGAMSSKAWSQRAGLIGVALAGVAGALTFILPAQSAPGVASAIIAIGGSLVALGFSGHALFKDRVRAILSTLAIGIVGMWPVLLFATFASCVHTQRCF
jgi:hypothetical protein